ncbi:hypothetical protein [Paenirhodobacter sp. CAU 1674]|uniref:hypothetical protein n=1 Tax=Paenirhodobacter sp. CAU 1674 TaxID=3032596 RepID=UPI0023DA21E4|nr:hypothetical protein [Paenirhodobacter sp. CAU 1674]MDF2143195.1 hypothetical protein [Paenirhodobacter sp. CAU 1674]
MNFDACLRAAVQAGTVDPARAQLAEKEYLDLVDRYKLTGYADADARIAAGEEVVESFMKRAKARRHATLRQLQTMTRNDARYANAHQTDPDLILKDLEWTEKEIRGLERQFMGGIQQFLEQHRTDILGRVRDRAGLKEIVQELHLQDSGNANAKQVAQAILQQYERARSLANSYGMDIGRLDDFGLPHSHDGAKIQKAGFKDWFERVYNGLDWHRMENFKTGKPFVVAAGAKPLRADAKEFLEPIYENLISDGWSKREASMGLGAAALKNARLGHRVLHFKSADDWWAYNEAFGKANPFDGVIGHLRGMARDIGLMRSFGPNPTAGLEHAIQVMTRDVARSDGALGVKAARKIERKGNQARVMLKILNGSANRPHDQALAGFLAGARNLMTAAQLGGAPLSQVTDLVSMRTASQAIGLNKDAPIKELFGEVLAGMNPQKARDLGFIMDTWFDASNAQARFMGDIWAPELTSRITNAVLRGNGLSFLTDRSRVAVAAAFGSDLADLAGRSFDQLDPKLRTYMENRGFGATDWDAIRDPAAIYTDATGGQHLNPTWFLEHSPLPRDQTEDIAIRFGALVQDHVEYSIPSTSLRGRAAIVGDARPGSVGGELLRSTLMYKSYSMSVMFNQIQRVAEIQGNWNRAVYVTKYVAMMTLMGGLAVQLKELAKGRDPRPMDSESFWAAALLQGGGVGIFGDFFSSSTSRAGGGFAETIGGPVVGLGGDILRAVASNTTRVAEGKDPLIGRDVVNMARRYNPVATFQPLIPLPTRLALDRMVWDQLQPFLDPEAEAMWRRQEAKLRKDYGTQSWWRRGRATPDRLPDLTNALGGFAP